MPSGESPAESHALPSVMEISKALRAVSSSIYLSTILVCSYHLHLISNQNLLDYHLVGEFLLQIPNVSLLVVHSLFFAEGLSGMEASYCY